MDRLVRRHGRAGRVEAAQVDVQLAVREAVGDLVRPVHGQGGLADACHPADGADHHGGRVLAPGGQQGVGLGEFAAPPGEDRQVGRQLRRAGRVRGGRGGGRGPGSGIGAAAARPGYAATGRRPVFGVHFLHGRAGLDTQLRHQGLAEPAVGGQRLDLTSRPVQRQHEQLAQPLAQRMPGGQRAQLGDHVVVAAELDTDVQADFERVQPLLVRAGSVRIRPAAPAAR